MGDTSGGTQGRAAPQSGGATCLFQRSGVQPGSGKRGKEKLRIAEGVVLPTQCKEGKDLKKTTEEGGNRRGLDYLKNITGKRIRGLGTSENYDQSTRRLRKKLIVGDPPGVYQKNERSTKTLEAAVNN